MFVLKLVTSLFLASLGTGSNHSPPGVSAVQPAVVPPSSSATAPAAPQPHSARGSDARHNNAHHHKDMTVTDLRKVFQVHSHADGMSLLSLPVSAVSLTRVSSETKGRKVDSKNYMICADKRLKITLSKKDSFDTHSETFPFLSPSPHVRHQYLNTM
jgi:hypothetical protein